ncbi:MAG: hypothetical protein V9E88_05060 [Ferruginibacter sp.]
MVGVAVNVTKVPAQTVVPGAAAMLTLTGEAVQVVAVITFELAEVLVVLNALTR